MWMRRAAASCVAGLLVVVLAACDSADLVVEGEDLRARLAKTDLWLAHLPQALHEVAMVRERIEALGAGLASEEARWTKTHGVKIARQPRDSPSEAVRWTTLTLSGGPGWADAGPLLDDLSRVRAAAFVSSVRFDENGSTWLVELVHDFRVEPSSSGGARPASFVWPWDRARYEENLRLRQQLEERLARPELAPMFELMAKKQSFIEALAVVDRFSTDLPALSAVAYALRVLQEKGSASIAAIELSRTSAGDWALHLDLGQPLRGSLLVATLAPLRLEAFLQKTLYARVHDVGLRRRAVNFESVRSAGEDALGPSRYADWVLSWAAADDAGSPPLEVALEVFPHATPGERSVVLLARTCEQARPDQPADLDAREALWARCAAPVLAAAAAANVPLERHAVLRRLAAVRDAVKAKTK